MNPRQCRVVALGKPSEARTGRVVLPALRAAPAERRRDRPVRSQLVQPRRRRARDGLCQARAGRMPSSNRRRRSRSCWSTTASCCSSTGCPATRRGRKSVSPNAPPIRSSAGSFRRSTSRRGRATTSTPRRARTCCARRTRSMRRGRWSTSTIRRRGRLTLMRDLLDRLPDTRLPEPVSEARCAGGQAEEGTLHRRRADQVDRRLTSGGLEVRPRFAFVGCDAFEPIDARRRRPLLQPMFQAFDRLHVADREHFHAAVVQVARVAAQAERLAPVAAPTRGRTRLARALRRRSARRSSHAPFGRLRAAVRRRWRLRCPAVPPDRRNAWRPCRRAR